MRAILYIVVFLALISIVSAGQYTAANTTFNLTATNNYISITNILYYDRIMGNDRWVYFYNISTSSTAGSGYNCNITSTITTTSGLIEYCTPAVDTGGGDGGGGGISCEQYINRDNTCYYISGYICVKGCPTGYSCGTNNICVVQVQNETIISVPSQATNEVNESKGFFEKIWDTIFNQDEMQAMQVYDGSQIEQPSGMGFFSSVDNFFGNMWDSIVNSWNFLSQPKEKVTVIDYSLTPAVEQQQGQESEVRLDDGLSGVKQTFDEHPYLIWIVIGVIAIIVIGLYYGWWAYLFVWLTTLGWVVLIILALLIFWAGWLIFR